MRKKMKVCNECGEDKPFSEFHKRSASPDGHQPKCKSCVKAYREANREKVAAQQEAYREANREKRIAASKAYYEANRDEIAAQKKAYREANRDEIAARKKAYREANREKLAARDKAYHAEKWANDPEYRARYAAADVRRKRLLASAVQEPYIREDIFERDNWTCQLCQGPIDSEIKWPESGFASIDHIVPISLGGDDTPDNVQAAHLGCNIGKSNRVELEDLQAA